jgi:hypothetical protein
MRAQDFVGWLVPVYLIAASVPALLGDVAHGTYSQMWVPLGGLALGVVLAAGLVERRREWMASESGDRPPS